MLYFAYGSNMNLNQMRSQCSLGFKVIGPAKLENYELGFDCRGYANIRAKPGEYVWGVLFDILKTCLIELDKCEGYNRDPRVYDRVKIPVVHGNKKVQAWVYVEEPQEFGRKPNLKYLKRIIEGAEENNLPADWLHKLKTFHIQIIQWRASFAGTSIAFGGKFGGGGKSIKPHRTIPQNYSISNSREQANSEEKNIDKINL